MTSMGHHTNISRRNETRALITRSAGHVSFSGSNAKGTAARFVPSQDDKNDKLFIPHRPRGTLGQLVKKSFISSVLPGSGASDKQLDRQRVERTPASVHMSYRPATGPQIEAVIT